MFIKKSKGFTLIELLVVIAIIGILAGIVLVNVNAARNKAKDAGIKGNMVAIPVTAELYYDDTAKGNGDYDGLCADTSVTKIETAVETITGGATDFVCATTTTTGAAWCACAPLKNSTNKYCIDSTGVKTDTATVCSTICTAASPDCQ